VRLLAIRKTEDIADIQGHAMTILKSIPEMF
jgi:hypothetical protein